MPEEFELSERRQPLHAFRLPLAMPPAAPADPSEQSPIDSYGSTFEARLNHRTVLKLDTILLPFVSLLFLLNSLDRSNVGNAETANFTKDTGLQPEDLNTAVACFFAFFVILQPVGAAVGRRYGMAKIVPGCMGLWGLCTAAHVLVRRKWELITIRILIGVLEGRAISCYHPYCI